MLLPSVDERSAGVGKDEIAPESPSMAGDSDWLCCERRRKKSCSDSAAWGDAAQLPPPPLLRPACGRDDCR